MQADGQSYGLGIMIIHHQRYEVLIRSLILHSLDYVGSFEQPDKITIKVMK